MYHRTTSIARAGALTLCVTGMLIAEGSTIYLIVHAPVRVADLAHLVAVMNVGILAYTIGIFAYCRHTSPAEAIRVAADTEQDLHITVTRAPATGSTLITTATRTTARRRAARSDDRRDTSLLRSIDRKLQAIDSKLARQAERRARAAEFTAAQPPSITDELRAYLAGRDYRDDT